MNGARCGFSQSEHVPLIKSYSTTRDRTLPPPVRRLGFQSHRRSSAPAAAALRCAPCHLRGRRRLSSSACCTLRMPPGWPHPRFCAYRTLRFSQSEHGVFFRRRVKSGIVQIFPQSSNPRAVVRHPWPHTITMTPAPAPIPSTTFLATLQSVLSLECVLSPSGSSTSSTSSSATTLPLSATKPFAAIRSRGTNDPTPVLAVTHIIDHSPIDAECADLQTLFTDPSLSLSYRGGPSSPSSPSSLSFLSPPFLPPPLPPPFLNSIYNPAPLLSYLKNPLPLPPPLTHQDSDFFSRLSGAFKEPTPENTGGTVGPHAENDPKYCEITEHIDPLHPERALLPNESPDDSDEEPPTYTYAAAAPITDVSCPTS